MTSDFLYPIAVTVSVLTTLLTPYLIKSSDAVVNWFDRSAPRSIATSLEVYTKWIGQLGANTSSPSAGKLVRRWSWQIGLNLVLMAGIFVTAVFLSSQAITMSDRRRAHTTLPGVCLCQ